jgi:stalled ribosome alternative rescue factor ArfA
MAAGDDVSQIVLQMPNAAAQLVIDPLFRRGVLFFKGGVRGNVLGYFFSPKDLFRKQIKAGGDKKG